MNLQHRVVAFFVLDLGFTRPSAFTAFPDVVPAWHINFMDAVDVFFCAPSCHNIEPDFSPKQAFFFIVSRLFFGLFVGILPEPVLIFISSTLQRFL